MKKISLLILVLLNQYMIVYAQTEIGSEKGINWVSNMSWEQVKEKAKIENKYIFVDAYATWCGPCKMMDKDVFPNDTVAAFMNDKFISVKLQMDKFNSDRKEVKEWYTVANMLGKQYLIFAYPTYLYFNPLGEIVHKTLGFQNVTRFIKEGYDALKPGRKFDHPMIEYQKQKTAFNAGEVDYSIVPELTRRAMEVGDKEFAGKLANEYYAYVFKNGDDEVYNKRNIEFLVDIFSGLNTGRSAIKSNSKLFKLFYDSEKKVDALLGIKGYSRKVVDATIMTETINLYLGNWAGIAMTTATPADVKIPDWKKMEKELQEKYNSKVAKRNILAAQIKFYHKVAMYDKWAPLFIEKNRKYGIDTLGNNGYAELNMAGWTMFQMLDNKEYLKKAVEFMKPVIKRHPKAHSYIDTYANLLYKAGDIKSAIKWETKAVALVGDRVPRTRANYLAIVEQMKKGEPTWTVKIFQ